MYLFKPLLGLLYKVVFEEDSFFMLMKKTNFRDKRF